jgi:hypothetical protein
MAPCVSRPRCGRALLFHRSTPLIMRTWARCLRHHSQRRWRRPRSIYPHRVPYVSSASASTDLRLANRPLMRGCISAYVCFCGMHTGSSLASVALTLPAAEEANGLGASASTARRGAACADARAGWPSGRRLCRDQPSALAIGSCWDRPSAFAGIDHKLQGELC